MYNKYQFFTLLTAIQYQFIYPISVHNSDRSIPNLSCQRGFTSLTKQKGSGRISLCLTILLCLSSDGRFNWSTM